MVCSICNSQSHRANKCNGEFVKRWTIRLAVYWLGDPHNPEAAIRDADNESVRVWAQEARFGVQAWKRLWTILDTIISERAAWRPTYSNFMRPIPQTIAGFKERIANYVRPNLPSILELPPQPEPEPEPEPEHTIKLVMVSDDTEFFKEDDCVCCLNPLNLDNTISFGCNHVTCSLCAPKVVKMVAGHCPTCRDNISKINFTQKLSPNAFNTLLSSLT